MVYLYFGGIKKPMELRHFRYFIVVAEELHFSRAAERLHMAQPPLSQQIQRLEQELGVPLLVRTKRSVHLTPAGRAFLGEARKVIAQAERAVEVAHQAHSGVLGQLAIGFVGSALAEALPSILKIFRGRFPRVEIKLHTLVTTEQVQALHNGQIHVGLLHPPILDASLDLEVIRREPLLVALPAEHALTSQESIELAQLGEEDFVIYPRSWNPGSFDQITSLCRAAGFNMRLGQEAVGMQSITSLVATGFGVSLVPASSQLLRSTGVVYRPLRGTTPTIDLAVAWLPEKLTPVTQNFLQVACETV